MTLRHVGDELYELMRGDLSNHELLFVNDHLRGCEPCRQELVDVSLAHALLMSVSDLLAPEFSDTQAAAGSAQMGADLPPLRFLEPGAAASDADELQAARRAHGSAPANRPVRGFERAGHGSDRSHSGAAPFATGLPRPAALDETARLLLAGSGGAAADGLDLEVRNVRSHRRRAVGSLRRVEQPRQGHRRARLGAAAVVAALLVGMLLGVGTAPHLGTTGGGKILLTAELLPLPAAPSATGSVIVRADGHADDVLIATSGLGQPPKGHYFEVLLVNPASSSQLPIGVLPPNGTGRLSFPVSLWGGGYAGVAITMQANGVAPSAGVAMLSTLAPVHHRSPHLLSSRPQPAPRRTHTHPAPRGPHRSGRPGVTGPSPSVLSETHTPPVVRRLLRDSAPQLSFGRAFLIDTTTDSHAVDPASGLCRDSRGRCSLRAAIEVADALRRPVTIRLPAGTYRLTLGPLVASDPAGVSIQGVSAARTIITSQGQIARLLVVERAGEARPAAAGHSGATHAGAGVVVSLSDLALRDGTAPSWGAWAGNGGAVLVADSADLLELSHVSILDSTATISGGGLFARGQVWATAVRFSNDSAGVSGGGVAFEHTEAVVADSSFLGDSAGSSGPQGGNGGAIEDEGSALVLVYSRFAGDSVTSSGAPARGGAVEVSGPAWLYSDAFVQDHAGPVAAAAAAAAAPGTAAKSLLASDAGGAVYLASGTVSVADCTFVGDAAQGSLAAGGALFNAASVTVIASRFVGNAATSAATSSAAAASTIAPAASVPGGGGAIYDAAELAMSGSVLSRNTASGNGGALSVSGSAVTSGSVFSWNRSDASGGAISDEGSLVLTQSTLSHNVARFGGGLYVDGSLRAKGDAVVDNTAVGPEAAGGGIYVVGRAVSSVAAAVEVRRSTIAGNVAPAGAGIAEEEAVDHPLPADISRSVIAGNHVPSGAEEDCAALGANAALFMTSRGGNVVGDTSCDLTATTDRQGPAAQGYWLADASGAVRACVMSTYGSLRRTALKDPVVAMAAAPGNDGYWEVTADGGVFNFGSASWFGSALGRLGGARVTAFAVTPDGGGYWLATSDGGVFHFGDAASYGSAIGSDIVAMARSVDGRGYWLLAANGTVHAFGDARSLGQHAGIAARAIASTPDGEGYWVAAADGAVYAFGDAASYGDVSTTGVVALLPSADGRGYRLVNSRGLVFSLGDAPPAPQALSLLPVTAAAT